MDDGSDDARHFARESFFQMEKQAEADAIAWKDGGNKQLFTKPSYRKRMLMGFFIQYAAQSTGAQVIYGKQRCRLILRSQCTSSRSIKTSVCPVSYPSFLELPM
jgi:hypothetical protein